MPPLSAMSLRQLESWGRWRIFVKKCRLLNSVRFADEDLGDDCSIRERVKIQLIPWNMHPFEAVIADQSTFSPLFRPRTPPGGSHSMNASPSMILPEWAHSWLSRFFLRTFDFATFNRFALSPSPSAFFSLPLTSSMTPDRVSVFLIPLPLSGP